MGYPTKIQRITRKNSQQWFVHLPAAVAQAMRFERGEVVEWLIEDRAQLVLRRASPPPSVLKKKRRTVSSRPSRASGRKHAKPSPRRAPGGGGKRLR